jgi:O-antigen/teichoic acid export membrane protein
MSQGSFLGRAGPLVLARFISACLTASIPLVLARMLSLSEYGTYKQIFLIAQTLYYVLPFGVAQSLYYFVPRVEEPRPYFGQTLAFLVSVGSIGAVALYALMPMIASTLNNPALLEYRVPLALYCAAALGGFPLELSLTSRGKTGASAASYLISDISRAVILTLPVLLGYGVRGLMTGIVLWALARFVAAALLMLRVSSGPLFDRRLFINQIAYALPFGAAILFSIPQQYAHQFMVSSSVTPELFAIYAVGCFQLPLVDLLYTPTSEVLMVRLGELDRTNRLHEAVSAFRHAGAKLSYFFLPLGAFLFAAAPEFIGAVFGPRYLPAVPIFRICVIGVPLATLPLDGTLRARDQTRYLFFVYALKAAVTVPLVYVGVKSFGMLGGIGSWAAAEVLGKALLLRRVPAALSTPSLTLRLVDVIPWKDLGKAALAAVAAALAVVALRAGSTSAWNSLPASGWARLLPLCAAGALFSIGYFATLRAVGLRPSSILGGFWVRKTA